MENQRRSRINVWKVNRWIINLSVSIPWYQAWNYIQFARREMNFCILSKESKYDCVFGLFSALIAAFGVDHEIVNTIRYHFLQQGTQVHSSVCIYIYIYTTLYIFYKNLLCTHRQICFWIFLNQTKSGL